VMQMQTKWALDPPRPPVWPLHIACKIVMRAVFGDPAALAWITALAAIVWLVSWLWG
jgi:hypothetical protein